jgi:hypothetical protein
LAGPIETTTISVAAPFSFRRNGFLDGDLVERVHAHLDVGEVDARAVRLHARLHVVIEHPFDGTRSFIGLLLRSVRKFEAALDAIEAMVDAARSRLLGGIGGGEVG